MRKRRSHRIRHRIGLVVLLILLATIIWNFAEYYKLKRTAEQYLKSTESIHVEEPVDLVGLLDSYGVPYSPSVEKSFMGYLEEDLENQGMLSSSLDLHGLYINKTWEVEGIFQNDVTIGEMKTMQNFGMDFVRHKYGKERIREDLVYTCDKEQGDVTVASYYSDLNRPVVLYSCAANDLFYYFGTSLESISLPKAVRIIRNLGNGLALLRREIKKNLETLTVYNPKAVIMVIGLYVPSDNILLQRAGAIVIDRINGIIEDVCEEYPNAVYVDVSCLSFSVLEGDFHPSGDGQKILKNVLASEMNRNTFTVDPDVLVDTEVSQEQEAATSLDLSLPSPAIADEWMKWTERYEKSNLDYVEWAVAAEKFLLEKGLDNLAYTQLAAFENDIRNASTKAELEGWNVLRIERKIQDQYDLHMYSLRPDVVNDKLSMLSNQSNRSGLIVEIK